jgi:ferrochelatase
MQKGVLLVNLGTPRSPTPQDVGVYLKEFLMDPYVIDIPKIFRWILVNALIVPKRKYASAKLYEKVWTEKGSPLLMHHLELTKKIQNKMPNNLVLPAMRYQEPSIEKALLEFKNKKVSKLTVLPLYPQYSQAATLSSIEEVKSQLKKINYSPQIDFIDHFYEEDFFIDAFTNISKKHLENFQWDKILFSFHGLPEKQIKKLPPDLNYKKHSYITAEKIAHKLGLQKDQYEVCFQSRLGPGWIKPFTDQFYRSLPKQGVKKIAVISPSFTADCLETLEEIKIRGREEFIENGGEDLYLVPSLNTEDVWIENLSQYLTTRE